MYNSNKEEIMIKVDVWYYSLDPYFYEGPGTLDRFDLEASTGEKR